MKRPACLLLLIPFIFNYSCSGPDTNDPGIETMREKINFSLENDEIKIWYPKVIDTVDGGYLERYSYDWKEDSLQDKYLVYEARHLWTTSVLSQFKPENKEFLKYARHGFEFLRDHLWDSQSGGFYLATDRKGNPLQQYIHEKRVYGQAFAIYALAEYYMASGDSGSLQLAQKEFNWLEKTAHDSIHGGYWEFLFRDGKPMKENDPGSITLNDSSTRGFKDYNSSIHLLEALSTLYHAWPDPVVKGRLEEMYTIISKTMVNPNGYLLLYFYGDWKTVPAEILKKRSASDGWFSSHVTFGHDIETAYLLLEAAESLGLNDSVILPIAKKLTDHTIRFGWDKINGGIFNDGSHITPDSVSVIDMHKSWWAEVEALNTLLLMSIKIPSEQERYYHLFVEQWNYIDRYLIDHTFGEFYNMGIDTDPENKLSMKAHAWKASYHTTRALVNCLKMLNEIKQKDLRKKKIN